MISGGRTQQDSDRDLDRAARERLHAQAPAPVDLVTASGSGVDLHLSPPAAHFQSVGEPRVNVLRVTLSLDSLSAVLETPRS
jgi:K+-transporting ATPase c subunit